MDMGDFNDMTSLEMLIAGSFVNLLQVGGCPVRRCSTKATLERCRTGRGFTAIAGGAGQGVVWARGRIHEEPPAGHRVCETKVEPWQHNRHSCAWPGKTGKT